MWAERAVVSALVGRHEMVHLGMLHPTDQSNNINAHQTSNKLGWHSQRAASPSYQVTSMSTLLPHTTKKMTRSPNRWTPWCCQTCPAIFVNGTGEEDPRGNGHGG